MDAALVLSGCSKETWREAQVSEDEVRQCFENREGDYLEDPREEHRTDPPTHWFVAETNRLRVLKVVFVARRIKTESGFEIRVEIKTAYPANPKEIEIYNRFGKWK